MGIFDASAKIRIGEIYNLSPDKTLAYIAEYDSCPDQNSEVYELCSITNQQYTFFDYCDEKDWHIVRPPEFIKHALESFAKCELGSQEDLIKQLREHCDYPNIRIDIVHDFISMMKKNQVITVPGIDKWNRNITKKITISFPKKEWMRAENIFDTWALLYIYKGDAPRSFRTVLFPLVPKEGFIDVFSAKP
jgi:hypothetical protein